MKKQLFLSLLAICSIAGTAIAQEGAQLSQQEEMEKAPNTLAKEAVIKLQSDLGVTGEQGAKVYAIFEDYYTKQQKAREEMRTAGEKPDWQVMKAKSDQIDAERDEKLQPILTAEQYTKWKDGLELSMRPQRKDEGNGRP